jgi:hypothetical protein
MIFWLSNNKLVRYDFNDEIFEELEGIPDINVMNIKVLQIGQG